MEYLNQLSMKYIFGIGCFLSILQLSAQKGECYCYQNSVVNYTEWIYIMNDSVVVIGQKNKICEDLNLDSSLDWARSGNYVWPVEDVDGQIKFTKLLTNPNELIDEIQYKYIGVKSDEGLEIHIDYTHNFNDLMGPPDRFYRIIELKE